MPVQRQPLEEFIRENNLISPEKLEQIEDFADEKQLSFERALQRQNKVAQEKVAKVLGQYLGLPYIDLLSQEIDEDALHSVPSVMAREHEIVPFRQDKDGIHIAMANPMNVSIKRVLEKKYAQPVRFYVTTEAAVEDISHLYERSLSEVLDKIISQDISKIKSVDEEELELPIIRITDVILRYAVSNKASDIHIEPFENYVQVRYRIDGILHDVVKIPKVILGAVVTRLKIMASLRIDEHFSAQDGRFDFAYDGTQVDARVSIVPITEGEKVVVRLFTDQSRRLTLEDLGLSEKALEKVKDAIGKPYGMILASGPTGSGKTTTMYAIMQLMNQRSINISTIEDPVEYDLEGINQIQVNEKTNLTFARGLRSILRQDPDIIMVGEIREKDAAGIAVNAAMTGHLVLSTLHANNASTTVPRLLDFQIKPFLLSSSLALVLSQRLVRRICGRCKTTVQLEQKEIEKINEQLETKDLKEHIKEHKFAFKEGRGCSSCNETGYSGRIGIYEVLEVDDEIRRLIMEEASAKKIQKAAVANGMTTMLEDGLDKVKRGITTIDEVVRVMSV